MTTGGDGYMMLGINNFYYFIKMKILNISGDNLKFWKGINLLDGQRRGEVIFRRVMVLLFGALVIYLSLLLAVGTKDGSSAEIGTTYALEVEEVKVEEVKVEEKEEWVDGAKVTTRTDGTVEVVPAVVFMESPVIAMKRFTQSYTGSRIDDAYFSLLDKNCSDRALRTVIAISVAESGMGKGVNKQSNFWGWFKGGNRSYDPSKEVMAKEICNGVEKYYLGIESNDRLVKKYTGNDRPTTWKKNFMWAWNQMEVK